MWPLLLCRHTCAHAHGLPHSDATPAACTCMALTAPTERAPAHAHPQHRLNRLKLVNPLSLVFTKHTASVAQWLPPCHSAVLAASQSLGAAAVRPTASVPGAVIAECYGHISPPATRRQGSWAAIT